MWRKNISYHKLVGVLLVLALLVFSTPGLAKADQEEGGNVRVIIHNLETGRTAAVLAVPKPTFFLHGKQSGMAEVYEVEVPAWILNATSSHDYKWDKSMVVRVDIWMYHDTISHYRKLYSIKSEWRAYSSQVYLTNAKITGGCWGERMDGGGMASDARALPIGSPSLWHVYTLSFSGSPCSRYYVDFSGAQVSGGHSEVLIHRGSSQWWLTISIGDY